ncbi:glycosyltransferase family protein [Caulobacter hibisci]|uniref:Glycosyltransferase family 1 protein n=1 Tax=Caulobacter hibisci TaxID=2035993 RepID=A0ABS0T205_9CAUL|nr:glycosyltransferase [Caulobacter hibisci]MBI1685516.1 glycosyltransferase family 1 protein [Caulobacter hibisci]
MRILLLKGQSQYDALRVFLDEAYAALIALGHQVVMFDLTDPEVFASLTERVLALGPFDFAFSYAIGGDWRAPDGRDLGQLIGGPHIIQHVDHPLTHLRRVGRTASNAVILTIDQGHAEVLRTVSGESRFAHVGFNPHAALGRAAPLPGDAEAHAAARPTRFMFTGSNYRPRHKLWADFPPQVSRIFDDAADLALSQDWIAPHRALGAALAVRGLDADHKVAKALMPHCARIHEWVRAHRRQQFLRAATEANLPLTVFGAGYEEDLHLHPNIDHRGPVGFDEVLAQMARSRIVLNVNVNFGEGSHERPLCAMLAGAVCASEPSTFYDSAFEIGRDMVYFRWSSLEDDLHRLAVLAEDADRLHAMAVSAQAKIVAHHTWKSRAEHLVALVHQLAPPVAA